MKKVQIRLSEQTYEDLIRVANGRPLQRFLEGMIDKAIQRTVNPPRERKPAGMDLARDPEATLNAEYHATMAQRQERLNRGLKR